MPKDQENEMTVDTAKSPQLSIDERINTHDEKAAEILAEARLVQGAEHARLMRQYRDIKIDALRLQHKKELRAQNAKPELPK